MDSHKAPSAPAEAWTALGHALRPAKLASKNFCKGELLPDALGAAPGHLKLLQARAGHAAQSRCCA